MKRTITVGALIGVACLMMSTPLAMAHDRSGVSWSVSIGSSFPPPTIYNSPPVVYVPAQPVYVQPHPVYVQPHPTYIVPQPIYVQPAPVVRFSRGYNERHWHPRHDHQQRQFRSHDHHHRRH